MIFWFLGYRDDGGTFEAGSSSDLLKISVKMDDNWSALAFRQAGETLSGPLAFLILCIMKTLHTSSSDLKCRLKSSMGEEGGRGVKGVIGCKIHFYMLFELKGVFAMCVHNHPIMIKFHPVFFFIPINQSLSQIKPFTDSWQSDIVLHRAPPTIVD